MTNPDQYKDAAKAAGATRATRTAVEAARVTVTIWAATAAEEAMASRASSVARAAGWYGYAAERQQCADDCREMLAMPVGVE